MREVELVWNGRTGEVSNIVLPFQEIGPVDELPAEGAPRPVAVTNRLGKGRFGHTILM